MVLANSPTREDVLLAILLATDAYDTPLIAGIKPDGTGNYGEREVPWIDTGQEISKHVLQEEKRENAGILEQKGRS